MDHPRLVTGTRVLYDDVRDEHLLLIPEGAFLLNSTAAEVLGLCDGERSLDDITATLSERYGGADVAEDIRQLLDGLALHGLVVDGPM
jgi:pyrroloquinoline quinone biosynthesis protein D